MPSESRAPTPPKTAGAGVQAASVLAITDDPAVKDMLLELALAEGFGVRCATTEVEAANLLRLERPGCCWPTWTCRGAWAPSSCARVKQSPYRDLPCLAVTASNDPMLAVSIDAPVFYKPDLEGLETALERLFANER